MTGADQYLLTVYIESQRNGAPVSSRAVTDRLDKSPPSVAEMLQRLDDRGLVGYEPYEGAPLMDAGRGRTADLHESEAMELAGVIDPSVADRLTTVLPVEELREEDGM
jgi:DtxR family Mn-dependent transcriptional regulator